MTDHLLGGASCLRHRLRRLRHNAFLPGRFAVYFVAFAFFAFAALAFLRFAASFARAAAESFRLGFFAGAGAGFADSLWNFAHLAFCAAAIRFLATALSFRRFRAGASGAAAVRAEPLPESMARSCAIWASI